MKLLGHFPALKEYGEVKCTPEPAGGRKTNELCQFQWIARGWRCTVCCKLGRNPRADVAPTRVCSGVPRLLDLDRVLHNEHNVVALACSDASALF
eukprot:9092342-Pyramimonas_sp.AAC.1